MTSYDFIEKTASEHGWTMHDLLWNHPLMFDKIHTEAERKRTTENYLREFNQTRKEFGLWEAFAQDYRSMETRQGFGRKFIDNILVSGAGIAVGYAACVGIESLMYHTNYKDMLTQFDSPCKIGFYIAMAQLYLLTALNNKSQ